MIALTSLVKNRAWILEYWLQSITALDWPKCDMQLLLLDDGSTDDSFQMLRDFADHYGSEYAGIRVLTVAPEHSFGDVQDSRNVEDRQALYAYLAGLRNVMLDACAELDIDMQFSVDSDILLRPDTLKALARHNLPYVSALVLNDNSTGYFDGDYTHRRGRWCNIGKYTDAVSFAPQFEYPLNSLVQVGMSGACYLANRQVLRSGARYARHDYGEDAWYCMQLRDRRIPIYCDTTPRTLHVMERAHLIDALAEWGRIGE